MSTSPFTDFMKHAKSKPDEIELELRYGFLSSDIYQQVFERLSKAIKQNIKEISIYALDQMGNSVNRRQTIFDPVTFQKHVIYIKKTRLCPPFALRKNTKIHLSREEKISEFQVSDSALIRFRRRQAFALNPKWRVDLTASLKIPISKFNQQLAKDTKEKLLFSNEVPSGGQYLYDLELEFLGDITTIKFDDITQAVQLLDNIIGKNVLDVNLYAQFFQQTVSLLVDNQFQRDRFRSQLGFKHLLPGVKSITSADYNKMFPLIGYYITDKADGQRSLMVLTPIDKFIINGAEIIESESDQKMTTIVVIEGELVNGVFYAYDILYWQDTCYMDLPFQERVAQLPNVVECAKLFFPKSEQKIYYKITDRDNMKQAFVNAYKCDKYECDGLILVAPDEKWKYTLTYKWKDQDHNTIDFLLKRSPEKSDEYWLFVGINQNLFTALGLQKTKYYDKLFPDNKFGQYFPTLFRPSTNPKAFRFQSADDSLNNKIVELIWKDNKWQFVQIRNDRNKEFAKGIYFGNNFTIAENIWMNHISPITFEQLYEGINDHYFQETKLVSHRAQTAIISFIKAQVINEIQNCDWAVDLGIGKGQDLGRYFKAGVKHLVGLDQDKTALIELIQRKHNFPTLPLYKNSMNTAIYLQITDLTEDFQNIAKNIKDLPGFPEKGCNAIISNLMVHYLLGNDKNLENLILLCKRILAPGGTITFTCMNGKKVDKLFNDKTEWQLLEDGVPKFGIKKLYKEPIGTGKKISVLLPFSAGKYYEEYLFDPDHFIKTFELRDFKLVYEKSFTEFIPSFEAQSKKITLTDHDKTWVGLYMILKFTIPPK
uniref:mRNA-capping enzyme n=1 Tax=Abalone asfa-like virus TaxID=2839893 RepID=A0A5K7XX28_9VIRU|nr:guanyltransferase pNP868R homolog protein [Abalone asfa-like virus]BCY04645.1 putative guanylyltransferase [Abalone asfa-like virus]